MNQVSGREGAGQSASVLTGGETVLDNMRLSQNTNNIRSSMQGKKPKKDNLGGGEHKGCGCSIF
jgi:hypothetical protein